MTSTTAAKTAASKPSTASKSAAKTKDDANCPCGSSESYESCCEAYHLGKAKPATAEQTMRSRYTAFVKGKVDYILDTHHPKTRDQIKREEVESWSKDSRWLGLEIIQTQKGTATDEQGLVSFVATFAPKKVKNAAGETVTITEDNAEEYAEEHGEHALFEKEKGDWKFVDASPISHDPYVRAEPKVGRNDPCSCGSGKKSKKCHGK